MPSRRCRFGRFLIPKIWHANLHDGTPFKDKVVILGSAAAIQHDFVDTPLDPATPGPVVHLQVMAAAMAHEFLRETPDVVVLLLVVAAGLAAFVVVATTRNRCCDLWAWAATAHLRHRREAPLRPQRLYPRHRARAFDISSGGDVGVGEHDRLMVELVGGCGWMVGEWWVGDGGGVGGHVEALVTW